MSLADQMAQAYRAGDYGQVQNWINSSGANANDIQSQFGLNSADMSWLTNNIGLKIPAAPSSPAPSGGGSMPARPGGGMPTLPQAPGGFDAAALQSWLNSNGYAPQGGRNPYLSGIADDLTRRSQQSLGQGLNMMNSRAIGVGGFGGSRQGVAEGLATAGATDALTGNLSNLFAQDWNNQQNRDLQRYGMDQGFYTSQRGQDLAQIGLGSQLETQALQNQWYPISQFANIVGNLSGQNTSTTNSTQTGGGALGALGGLLGTAQLGTNLKWW